MSVVETISSDHIITVIADGLRFPGGPAFAPDGSLWAVEQQGESLILFADNQLKRIHVGGSPNGIAIDKEGMIWFCDSGNNAIRKFNTVTGSVETVADRIDGEPLSKPNDLCFDNKGNLLFTCPGQSKTIPAGYACVLQANGKLKRITAGKYFPNGLAFTDNGCSLVMAETYRHRLWKGGWCPDRCEWTNENVWCEIGGPDGPGGPDGMAFDENGVVYVAVYGTGQLRCVNGNGLVSAAVDLPGPNPTNCAFDPAAKLGLVVTEAGRGELLSITGLKRGQSLFQ